MNQPTSYRGYRWHRRGSAPRPRMGTPRTGVTTPRIAPPPPQGHHALRALEMREQCRHRVSSFSLSVVGGIADGEIEWYGLLPPELVGRLIPDANPTWSEAGWKTLWRCASGRRPERTGRRQLAVQLCETVINPLPGQQRQPLFRR